MQTKTSLRKTVGRGKFTAGDLAKAAELSAPVARRRLAQLVEAGVVTKLDETQKVTDADGNPHRGKPRDLYRVSGK